MSSCQDEIHFVVEQCQILRNLTAYIGLHILVCTFFVFRDTFQQDAYFTEDASLIGFPCRCYHFHPIISISNRCFPLFLISNFHTSFDTLCNLKSECRQQQTLSQIARFAVFCTHFAVIVLLYQI